MRTALACLGIAFALGALAAPAVASSKAPSMRMGHKNAMHMGSHHKGTSSHRSGSTGAHHHMHMNMKTHDAGRPKTGGLWDFPKADFGVGLGLAALIGVGGGFIYAGILGPKV